MWYVRKADKTNWVIKRGYAASSESYLVSLFSEGLNHQVCVGLIDEAESDFIIIESEIFSTFFWGDSDLFIGTFLTDFVRAENQEAPVELVYLYGGTVQSETIRIATKGGLH